MYKMNLRTHNDRQTQLVKLIFNRMYLNVALREEYIKQTHFTLHLIVVDKILRST